MNAALDRPLLVTILLQPARANALTLPQWDLLVRQARRANLLARLAGLLAGLPPVGPMIPTAARLHLDAALLMAQRQREVTQREVQHIQRALTGCDAPVVLLKGAAYLMAGLDVSQGRLFSDVDILVPREALGQVETALMVHGWSYGELDAYDRRYYQQWMHELPPLQHSRRGTAIDVHHTILPPTARLKIDTAALFEHLQPLPDHAGLYVLPPADMLLHSAAHLFHEGEFDNGLRDLFDLDALLREFGTDASFWPQVLERAQRIGLLRPLHHALHYTRDLLGTPVPGSVLKELAALPGASPRPLTQALLDHCFHRALRARHSTCELPGTERALTALLVRSHWLRMPLWLLTRHLGRKQFKRWFDTAPKPRPQPEA